MSGTFRSLGLAAAVTLAFAAGAAAAPQASQTKPAKSAKATTGSHSVSGTLEKFDASGKMLTLKTSTGSETLTLSSDAKIHQGSQSLSAADLSAHTGSRVRVHYTESNGQKTAQDVMLSAPSNKPTKKSGY